MRLNEIIEARECFPHSESQLWEPQPCGIPGLRESRASSETMNVGRYIAGDCQYLVIKEWIVNNDYM